MYFVYAIKSTVNSSIYIGLTSNVVLRLRDHNMGKVRSTKPYKPYKLTHVETVNNRMEARRLEKYFKSGFGKETLKLIID